jgi:spoIIIJ-associated protein
MVNRAKSYEFDGGTVEEAIKNALSVLKVSRETINVKVLSEEQRGLFGMEGAKPAKIMVTIKEKKA